MTKIFHNPRCRKSREGLKYLESKTSEYTICEYLKEGLTQPDISEILLKSGLKPSELVRTQEEIYKKELKGRNFTDNEWIAILVENPILLQRPIIVGKYKAVLAIPPERADEIFSKNK
jgi:arsenate reductase (glutaredoxin)